MRVLIAAALFMAGRPAAAEGPLDGRWVIDAARDEYAGKPIARLLKDGVFRCASCVSDYRVPADGSFHPITGQDCDAVAVRALDGRAMELRCAKRGRLVETLVERVSADGRTLDYRMTNVAAPNGRPQVQEGRRERVGAAPAGAHPVSGEWRPLAGAAVSADALTLTIRTEGELVSIVQPTGQRVAARLGGPPAPVQGDGAGRAVRVERAGPRAIRMTTLIAGEPVAGSTLTAAEDGRTLLIEWKDLKLGQTGRYTAIKR